MKTSRRQVASLKEGLGSRLLPLRVMLGARILKLHLRHTRVSLDSQFTPNNLPKSAQSLGCTPVQECQPVLSTGMGIIAIKVPQ